MSYNKGGQENLPIDKGDDMSERPVASWIPDQKADSAEWIAAGPCEYEDGTGLYTGEEHGASLAGTEAVLPPTTAGYVNADEPEQPVGAAPVEPPALGVPDGP